MNAPYMRLLKLWLAQSAAHMPGDLHVGCMDMDSYAQCAGLERVTATALPQLDISRDSRHSLLVRHMAFFRSFLEQGHDILHTDIDAFWHRAPLPDFAGFDDDIICSTEFGIPRNLAAKWGFVLCAGFYLARSTPGTTAFFARWQERLEYHTREQIAFNQLLDSLQPFWEDVALGGLTGKRCRVEIDGQPLSVLALPYELVTRDSPFTAPHAAVAHPYFERPFFTSHVELLEFVLSETGATNGYVVPDEALVEVSGLSPRDAAALCALKWRLAASPASGPNWTHLGCLQLRHGDRPGAALSFDQALLHGVDDPNSQLALGLGLRELGNREQARRILRRTAANLQLEALVSRQAAIALISLGAVLDGLLLGVRSLRRFGFRESARLLPLMVRNKLRGAL
ncbi:putative nucleotide-diphospho-sugar transferase [Emcibacter sp. SYSU 3D8]|uniref:putative nucleotide-diphospho-sugar transferase n=1 Tax=Emcibacter sp. SYSU 3D8 TaxID=3133969 RepID=UPI0031FE5A2D